jgi:hypothetical protein
VFHFQKALGRFRQIMAHCGCWEHVTEDLCHTAPAAEDFGAGSSSVGATHDDDVPDLGLDLNMMADVLS